MRGRPSKLVCPESDTVSMGSAPVSAPTQKESFRQSKKPISKSSYSRQSSEDNKLWLSREFPELAVQQNESKSQTSSNNASTNTTSIKRRVSRVESLRNLFFNRGSNNNNIKSSNAIACYVPTARSGGRVQYRPFIKWLLGGIIWRYVDISRLRVLIRWRLNFVRLDTEF